MSEKQPTGVTVYYDGEATNYPTATRFYVDAGALYIEGRDRTPREFAADPGSRAVAVYASTRWDFAEVHQAHPNAVVLHVDGKEYRAELS